MELRDYQEEAIIDINHALSEQDGNPVCCMPTGSGKTIVFCKLIQLYITEWPGTRILILSHIKELLVQAQDKLKAVWPEAPIGIYSAGLKSKVDNQPVTIAGIQSVYKKAGKMDPFHIVIVDEAHRIPLKDEGMYRQFINDAKAINPKLRVIGFTATPFRLDGGLIYGPDYVLNNLCHEGDVQKLIKAKWLCNLTTKHGNATPDVSHVSIRGGDFVVNELSEAVDKASIVKEAVTEAVKLFHDRKSIIFFCCTIAHAEHVSQELKGFGINAPALHSETPDDIRDKMVRDFDSGHLRGLCNVNILAEGFDSTRIDCIVMLRPTASTGLYVQQVGRGFRPHPGKRNCLILDFADNIMRHGTIDMIRIKRKKKDETGDAPVKVCPDCQAYVHAAHTTCPECGHEFPPREISHNTKAHEGAIINRPEKYKVLHVEANRHFKNNKTTSMVVSYNVTGSMWNFRQWICLEHKGFARMKAEHWWVRRFGNPIPETVSEALDTFAINERLTEMTDEIEVVKKGKYFEIQQIQLKKGSEENL